MNEEFYCISLEVETQGCAKFAHSSLEELDMSSSKLLGLSIIHYHRYEFKTPFQMADEISKNLVALRVPPVNPSLPGKRGVHNDVQWYLSLIE